MAAHLDLWSLLLGQGAASQASKDEPLLLSRQRTYVVVLDSPPSTTALPQVVYDRLGRVTPGLQPRQLYEQLGAFSVDLDDNQARRLRAQNGIGSVEADRPIPAMPPVTVQPDEAELQGAPMPLQLTAYANTTSASGEILPWGVRAVWSGIDVGSKGNIGTGSTVFVIDSGVLATTGDLNLNSAWSRSWIAGESAFSDGVGHGTHVAGTIAALANGIGVVGVAPGAEVVSLKVFANSGGGASITSIIDAINYAVGLINTNGLDRSKVVINMSLGGGLSSSLTTAIVNAANQGIRFSIAAGNSGQDADGFSPANAGTSQCVHRLCGGFGLQDGQLVQLGQGRC
jgi:subtilisin family serine protease